MPLLLNSVQALLVSVLSMGDETGVFGCPRRMRGPLVIQHRLAKLVPPRARLEALPLGQEPVAGTKPAAIAQGYSACRRLGSVLNDFVDAIVLDQGPQRAEKFGVATHELVGLVDQDVFGNQVLIPEIEEFEELGRRGPISDVLLHLFEKRKVVLRRDCQRGGAKRLWHDGRQRGLDEGAVGGARLVRQLCPLVGRRHGREGSSQSRCLRLV